MNVCLEIDVQPINAPQYGVGRKKYYPQSACYKVGYPTRDAAQRAVHSLAGRRKKVSERGIYACKFCGEWHLTSQERR